jgi:hypothetical protein
VNKYLIVFVVACSFLFSGCAAVVQGGAALAAGSAKDHPANQSFAVGAGKSEAFNVAMRALTASGRKVTASDREAGIVQGEVGDYAVTIKIGGKAGGAVVDITVAYNQSFIFGSSQMEKIAGDLKGEIEAAAGHVKVTQADVAVPVASAAKVQHAHAGKKADKVTAVQ